MVDHTIEAHFEVTTEAAVSGGEALAKEAAQQEVQRLAFAMNTQAMITDCIANALLGGNLGQNPHNDVLARAKATEFYVMGLAFLDGLSEAGVLSLTKQD